MTPGSHDRGPPLTVISSMATKAVLAALVSDYARQSGQAVHIESVGGVDAARRVQSGEPFDVVILASDAVDRLIASGEVQAGSRVDLVRSPVAIAVRAGAPHPDVGSEAALRDAVRAARHIGYSTGPSGQHLDGVDLLGTLPADCAYITTFSAGLCVGSALAEPARDMLRFMTSPASADAKRSQGMAPA